MDNRIRLRSITFLLGFLAHSQTALAENIECPFSDCHLERSAWQNIHARLDYDIKPIGELAIEQWTVCTPELPKLECQTPSKVELFVVDTTLTGNSSTELSPLRRSVSVLHLSADKRFEHHLPVRDEFKATLFKTRLLPGKSQDTIPSLSKSERENNLCETFTFDYKDPVFQEYLRNSHLMKSGKETDLSFAWRVFCFLKSKFRYSWNQTLDRRASLTCKTDATDCGGLSYLYCSILRANRIPARALIGRWATSSPGVEDFSNSFKCHIRSEFYVEGIGWIPVDVSEAVSNRKRNPTKNFGVDNGDFIVMHTNPDLVLDSIFDGKKHIRSMPDFRVWVKAKGKRVRNESNKNPITIPRQIYWNVKTEPIQH